MRSCRRSSSAFSQDREDHQGLLSESVSHDKVAATQVSGVHLGAQVVPQTWMGSGFAVVLQMDTYLRAHSLLDLERSDFPPPPRGLREELAPTLKKLGRS